MSATDATCGTCRFGLFHERTETRDCAGMMASPAHVDCRRYPAPPAKPRYGMCDAFRNPFPRMKPDDWCGEHQPKDQS